MAFIAPVSRPSGYPLNYYGNMRRRNIPQTRAFPSAGPHNNHVPISARESSSFQSGIPHSGSHDGWGSTLGEKIGTAGAFASLQGTPPVSPVHTSSVHVRKRVLKYQRTDDLKSAFGSPAEQGQEQAVFDGPVELQAQFLQGDLALPIELAIEQNKGMKQVEGQQRDQQTGQD